MYLLEQSGLCLGSNLQPVRQGLFSKSPDQRIRVKSRYLPLISFFLHKHADIFIEKDFLL